IVQGTCGLPLLDAVQYRSKDNRLAGGSFSHQFSSLVNDQCGSRGLLAFGTFDNGTGLDGQGRPIANNNFPVKDVDVLGSPLFILGKNPRNGDFLASGRELPIIVNAIAIVIAAAGTH